MPTWICLTMKNGHRLPVRADAVIAFPPISGDPADGCEIWLAGGDGTPFQVVETQDELRKLLGVG